MPPFVELVKELLVSEFSRTPEEAEALVKRFPNVMVNAMMAGRGTEYRACCMALELAELNERDNATPPKENPGP